MVTIDLQKGKIQTREGSVDDTDDADEQYTSEQLDKYEYIQNKLRISVNKVRHHMHKARRIYHARANADGITREQ